MSALAGGMATAVRTVVVDCLGTRAGETVVVVSDPPTGTIGRALRDAAEAIGAEAVLVEMAERETHGTEPPAPIALAMASCDVFIGATAKSLSHTAARKAANEAGARAATMPGITEDMLIRTMAADYAAVARRSRAIARMLTDGSTVTITSANGSDLTLSIEGRDGISDDGDLSAPGAFGNLPAGEGFIAPVEGSARGRLVVDGTVWPIGRVTAPLVIDIEDGYAVKFDGPDAPDFESVLSSHGRDAYAVAELGIGTNEAAQLTGNVLEDEKIMGTIHVAFGDNHSFGGTIRVSSHQDGIVLAPTCSIDGVTVVDGGRLLVEGP